jgi:hypothetical protein
MIRLGTQDDLQQIDIFDEFGGDRIQEIKENRLTGLKQKSSPNKPQTSFISYEYVTVLVEP